MGSKRAPIVIVTFVLLAAVASVLGYAVWLERTGDRLASDRAADLREQVRREIQDGDLSVDALVELGEQEVLTGERAPWDDALPEVPDFFVREVGRPARADERLIVVYAGRGRVSGECIRVTLLDDEQVRVERRAC